MANRGCCVVGCRTKQGDGVKFYPLPCKPQEFERREKWIDAIRRAGNNGPGWEPTSDSYVCSRHFISGQLSSEEGHVDYIPSYFPTFHSKRTAQDANLQDTVIIKKVKRPHMMTSTPSSTSKQVPKQGVMAGSSGTPARCCVVDCNTTKAKGSWALYEIPRNPIRRKAWLTALRLEGGLGRGWQPSEDSYVCSKHFVDRKMSNNENSVDFVPELFYGKIKSTPLILRGVRGRQPILIAGKPNADINAQRRSQGTTDTPRSSTRGPHKPATIVCSVEGCKGSKSKIGFYNFPVSGSASVKWWHPDRSNELIDLRAAWIIALKLDPAKINATSFVCSLHFSQHNFLSVETGEKSMSLLGTAVPDNCLPEYTDAEEVIFIADRARKYCTSSKAKYKKQQKPPKEEVAPEKRHAQTQTICINKKCPKLEPIARGVYRHVYIQKAGLPGSSSSTPKEKSSQPFAWEKPSISLKHLIILSLINGPVRGLVPKEIVHFIQMYFPFYKSPKNQLVKSVTRALHLCDDMFEADASAIPMWSIKADKLNAMKSFMDKRIMTFLPSAKLSMPYPEKVWAMFRGELQWEGKLDLLVVTKERKNIEANTKEHDQVINIDESNEKENGYDNANNSNVSGGKDDGQATKEGNDNEKTKEKKGADTTANLPVFIIHSDHDVAEALEAAGDSAVVTVNCKNEDDRANILNSLGLSKKDVVVEAALEVETSDEPMESTSESITSKTNLVKKSFPNPGLSYRHLICLALINSPSEGQLLRGINVFITYMFPFFNKAGNEKLRNEIGQALRHCHDFIKGAPVPGEGFLWKLDLNTQYLFKQRMEQFLTDAKRRFHLVAAMKYPEKIEEVLRGQLIFECKDDIAPTVKGKEENSPVVGDVHKSNNQKLHDGEIIASLENIVPNVNHSAEALEAKLTTSKVTVLKAANIEHQEVEASNSEPCDSVHDITLSRDEMSSLIILKKSPSVKAKETLSMPSLDNMDSEVNKSVLSGDHPTPALETESTAMETDSYVGSPEYLFSSSNNESKLESSDTEYGEVYLEEELDADGSREIKQAEILSDPELGPFYLEEETDSDAEIESSQTCTQQEQSEEVHLGENELEPYYLESAEYIEEGQTEEADDAEDNELGPFYLENDSQSDQVQEDALIDARHNVGNASDPIAEQLIKILHGDSAAPVTSTSRRVFKRPVKIVKLSRQV